LVVLGIALLVFGAGLLVAEAHLPTYGVLGVAGLGTFVAGAAVAIDAAGGGAVLVVTVVVMLMLLGAVLLRYVGGQALLATRSRVRTGPEALVGQVGVVRTPPAPLAQVFVDGALWRARPCWEAGESGEHLREGETVVVERVQGLTLSVRRAEQWELEA
jgi:membrane-bound ClpP family serine protease